MSGSPFPNCKKLVLAGMPNLPPRLLLCDPALTRTAVNLSVAKDLLDGDM